MLVSSASEHAPASLSDVELSAALAAAERVASALRAQQALWLAEAQRRELPRKRGAGCDAAWVASELRISKIEARRRLSETASIAAMPVVGESLARGAITPEHVRSIGATQSEAERLQQPLAPTEVGSLVSAAAEAKPGPFSHWLRRWRAARHVSVGVSEAARHREAEQLTIRTRPDDGMVEVNGVFAPVNGPFIRAAIGRINEQLWRAEKASRSDAEIPSVERTNSQRLAAAFVELCRRMRSSQPASRGEAMQVVAMIRYEDLVSELDGLAAMNDGTSITAAEARLMACEAGILPAVFGGASELLDLGRSARLASPQQRLALRMLYDGCAVDGCEVPFDHCQIHHVSPWESGGPTDLDDLLPMCSGHHHNCHDGKFAVWWPDGDRRQVRSLSLRRLPIRKPLQHAARQPLAAAA